MFFWGFKYPGGGRSAGDQFRRLHPDWDVSLQREPRQGPSRDLLLPGISWIPWEFCGFGLKMRSPKFQSFWICHELPWYEIYSNITSHNIIQYSIISYHTISCHIYNTIQYHYIYTSNFGTNGQTHKPPFDSCVLGSIPDPQNFPNHQWIHHRFSEYCWN